jgi:hypothetical protein
LCRPTGPESIVYIFQVVFCFQYKIYVGKREWIMRTPFIDWRYNKGQYTCRYVNFIENWNLNNVFGGRGCFRCCCCCFCCCFLNYYYLLHSFFFHNPIN